MKKRLLFFVVGGSVFLFFIFFSYLVHKDLFTQFDFNTTVRVQDNVPQRFDESFSWLSEFGKFEPSLLILIGAVVFLTIRKKFLAFLLIGAFAAFHLIEIFGKRAVEQFPPPQFLLRTRHLIDFPQFHIREEFSYPSGHSGRAIFLTFVIGFIIIKSNKIPKMIKFIILSSLALYDVIMLFSRVSLGEHWLSDVIGGAILGASLAFFSALFI